MARITLFAAGKIETAKNGNKFAVVELMKTNGMLTKRMKAVLFEKDIDLEALAAAKKGDLVCNGEISTVKVAPYQIGDRTVETATLLIPEGDEVDAIISKKKLSRAVAPKAAEELVIENLQSAK